MSDRDREHALRARLDAGDVPASFARTDLPNHPWRGPGAAPGWAGVVFAAPFVAIGLGALLLSLDAFGEYERIKRAGDAPWFVLFTVGLIFLSAGLSLGAVSARLLVRARRARRARGEYPGQPWMWEHAWEPTGAWDDEGASAVGTYFAPAIFTSFLVLPHWALLTRDVPFGASVLLGCVLALFDLIVIATWRRAFRETARRARHGRTRVGWRRLPLALGEPVELTVQLPTSLPAGSVVAAELRCVREAVVETRGTTRRSRRKHVVHRVLWRDRRQAAGGSGTMSMAFAVPADAPPTNLLDPQPTYWELALSSEIPGADFAATYLLPVYAGRR